MSDTPTSTAPSSTPTTPRLLATDLVCDRGGRRVLDGVGFFVGGDTAAGNVLFVTGPNGVGKSTLLRLVAGLGTLESGEIRLEAGGGAVTGAEVAECCHYLGHRDALKTALTVAENLAFWRDFLAPPPVGAGAGHPALDLDDALAAVDLDALADLPAGLLSAGQRRRLAVARLLVVRRPLWLLDEPTSALDAASEARLVALMAAHAAAGGLIMAATHLPIDLPGRSLALRPAAVAREAFA